MANAPAKPRMGMMVRQSGGFRGESNHHYYNQLIEVLETVEDKDYGAGIAGYSALTGRPVIVFSNPVPSEYRKNSRNTKTMTDWVNGLRISGGTYTLGPGAWALVKDITVRKDVPPRKIVLEGYEVTADVLFCQSISSWKSMEQVEDDRIEPKDVFWGYAIARAFRSADGQERVHVHVFQPIGPDNRMNTGNGDYYPVIFSFNSMKDLADHVDKEAASNPGHFGSYMVRVRDKGNGMIVAGGEIISAYDYRNPTEKTSNVFLRNLARRLSLTTSGIDALLGDPDYVFEIYGLMDLLANSFSSNDEKASLSEQILNNETMVRRSAPRADGGGQVELVAVPCALRGKTSTETGAFWLDKAQIIGYVGRNRESGTYSADSDIISADAYSGTPPDETSGHLKERGYDRFLPEFGENESAVQVGSLRDLVRALGCETILFPNGQWDQAVFEAEWDRRGKPAKSRQPEPEAPQAAPQRPNPRQRQPQAAPQAAPQARRPQAAPQVKPSEDVAEPEEAQAPQRPNPRQRQPQAAGQAAEAQAPQRPNPRVRQAQASPQAAPQTAEANYDAQMDDIGDDEEMPF